MKITSLHLKNITCFEEINLSFGNGNWVVLLGENGTGKTTILQMIAAALSGGSANHVAGFSDWSGYLRDLNVRPQYVGRLCFQFQKNDIGYEGNTTGGHNEITFGPTVVPSMFSFFLHPDRPSRQTSPARTEAYNTLDPTKTWFSCGYSSRRSAVRNKRANTGLPTVPNDKVPYRFASLFGVEDALTNVTEWLADLYFRILHPSHTQKDEARYELAVAAIEKCLPGITIDRQITPDRKVMVSEAGTTVSLDRLSEGYRSTLGWIGDLVRRLCDAYPDSPDPLQEHGVVLVDEIDLHLHPRWQRSVVEDVRRLFPNLQFIVTTHSPFIAQDMTEKDKLIVLKRETDKNGRAVGPVRAEDGGGFAKGWRVDQILTSFLFDLPGTRDDAIVTVEQEYQRLLDAEATRRLKPAERARLTELQTQLDLTQSAPGETQAERDLYNAADAAIAALKASGELPPLPDEDEAEDAEVLDAATATGDAAKR